MGVNAGMRGQEPLTLPVTPGEGEASLPAVPETAVEPVIDGEVIERPRPVYDLRPAARTAVAVARHPHTRTAGRHLAYIPAGAVVAFRRRARQRSLLNEMAHLEAARGNTDKALEWAKQEHERQEKQAERRRKAWETAHHLVQLQTLKGIAIVAGVIVVLLVMTGWMRYLVGLYHLVSAVAAFAWGVRYGVPVAVLAWFWHLGRTADGVTGWNLAAKSAGEERGLVVTADSIVVALQNLPVPELKKACKGGWQPSFHTLPVKDGEGYFSVFSLPYGVTATMVADKNEIFARNLHRAKTESWPTDAEREKIAPAGYVALWVANPGVLDRPAPEYPLLHDGTADVFKGVPGGVTARGDQVLLPVVANNLVLGGQMGNGKSNGCRVFMLGCALDPLCELDAFVFAGNGDFDSFAPRLNNYVKGADEATVIAAVARLEQLLEEVGHRELRLAELGAKKLTRHLAEKHPDLHPIVSLYSECHELFGHDEYGALAADLAVKIIKRARKTGIVLAFDTQSSRAGAIPSELVELVSVNGCFYVKTWRSNDGFLGDGSFQAGIRATELRPGRDVGRSLITGVSDAQFELLKWFYIFSDDDTGADDATPVIARAMRQLAPGTRVSGGDGASLPVITVRDLLADLAEVMSGTERVRMKDLAVRLRKMAPTWGPYRTLDGTQLQRQLDDLGVRTLRVGNVPQLDPGDLRMALAEREVGSRP